MADGASSPTDAPSPAGPTRAGTLFVVVLSLASVIGCGLLFAHISRSYKPRRG